MAYKVVTEYVLIYKDYPRVLVKLQGENVFHNIVPNRSDAVYVADMLRYEKPVYYDAVGDTLATSVEEVGEEET